MILTIDSVTHHGMGRAGDHLIPRALPGEVVDLSDDATARIVTPSPQRVKAPCRHFKTCGGCAMQHASDAFVASWKAGIVAKALDGHGMTTEITGVITSPAQSRRRARLSGRRTKAGALVGFHGRASDQIVAIPDCLLVTPKLRALFPALEALTVIAASRTTEVGLTITDTLDGTDVLIDGAREITSDIRRDVGIWAETHGVARVTWQALAGGTETVAQRSPPLIAMGRAKVTPPPGGFLQATMHGEAAILAGIQAATKGAHRILDLFAGSGTFTLPLADRAEVHAVESEAAMLAALDKGWRNAAVLHKVTTEMRDLFRNPLIGDELKGFDAAIIDPPRAGAAAQVAEIVTASLPIVVMVSCNPVTFARDARDARDLIAGGYRMGPVTVVDQFRWSTHLEVFATFTKA